MDSSPLGGRVPAVRLYGACIALLFVIDVLLPLKVVLTAPYLLLMWWGIRLGRQQSHWEIAAGVTVLVLVDMLGHRQELRQAADWLIQGLALVSMWLAAGVATEQWRQGTSQLLSHEGRFKAMMESAPDAMLFVDYTGCIVMVNQEAEDLFGYRREEMLGEPVEILLPEPLRERHRQHLEAYFEHPQKREMGEGMDLEACRKDGTLFPTLISLSPLETTGEEGVIAAVRDISVQKEHEKELLRMNSELESFAYVASHDLKAPLRVIDNASRWLVEDLGDQLQGDDLENLKLLRMRAQRMSQFLDDLLEYSRVGRRFDARYQESVPARELFNDLLFMLEPPETFKVIAEGDWDSLQLTRMPLQHLLANLVGNAIKHHHKKEGLIRVVLRNNKCSYYFEVIDDGPGIDPVYHEKIFEMFQTLQSRDRVEGSGMGLAIARKIVETYGGTIEVESELGKGSTFIVEWPKKPIKPEQRRLKA